MTGRPRRPGRQGRQGRHGRRSSRGVAVLLLALGVVLLGSTLAISVAMTDQIGTLREKVELTDSIVDANVRTLTQAQRELLRLENLVATDRRGGARLQVQLVTQRVREGSLSYQQQTLGSGALLQRARTSARTWERVVLPDVEAWRLGGAGAAAAGQRALQGLAALELDYNRLVSDGEINRKEQAGAANADTEALQDRAWTLLVGLVGTFVAAAAAFGVGGVVFVRFQRQRDAAQAELLDLNRELERSAHVVQATTTMVVVTDPQGRIEWVNEAFERTTGWRLDEVVGRSPGDFLQGAATDAATVARMGLALGRGERFRAELANYTATGEEFWVSLDVTPVHDAAGALTGFVGVQSDVTERHEAEELLHLARADAEESARQKASFLATMSHEIRTPLNAVLGLTDLLLLTDLDAEQREYAATAHRSGRHLLSLLNDVLDYSALEAGRLDLVVEPVALEPLLADLLAMFAPQAGERGLHLDLVVDPALPATVEADATHLNQVLVNLLGNAVKFTESGSVRLLAETGPPLLDPPLRDTRAGDLVLRLRVVDTGIGIDADRVPLLFQPFARGDVSATRRYGGTGLGLSICKQVVEGLGGRIEVRSERGRGTEVVVDLPVRAAAAAAPAAGADQPTAGPAGAALSVVVAEDDPVNQVVVVHMLRRLGLDPVVVGDGLLAVEAVLAGEVDLLLLDVQMPVMDGVTAAAEIRARVGGHAPYVVALTAEALAGDRERLLACGMDDYVSKPVDLASLREVVARAAAHRRPSAA